MTLTMYKQSQTEPRERLVKDTVSWLRPATSSQTQSKSRRLRTSRNTPNTIANLAQVKSV